ncbi:hypothetical protein [Geminocystis sp. NIES-3709]|uniref:hypothetical protein n=1 Tax=Geminocystis sp. NIES-3709 TaxID=1617448 RepID=UPI0005FC83B4|nr:hypothetical protein [Geminocystis sp. NIES-3709]BAQ63603.1 cytochrome C553 [Geminocystis sp. NIES-3709]
MLFTTQKQISGVAITLVAIASNLSFMNIAKAEEISCQGTLGAITVDNVKVPQGKTCTLNGTTVKGNIVVNNRATLKANGAKVNGNIQAEGATAVNVNSNTTVGGSIQIKQGGSASIVSNKIQGDVQLESNSGKLTVSKNNIGGNLQCKENKMIPVGGDNIVEGNKEDQCSKL